MACRNYHAYLRVHRADRGGPHGGRSHPFALGRTKSRRRRLDISVTLPYPPPPMEARLYRADLKNSMIKFVYCVRRRPDIAPEAFRKYWLENHGPLVRRCATALRAKRYVQSHTLDTPLNAAAQQPRGTKPPYDGLTELWWDSADDLVQALNTPEFQEANRTLARDEASFCDLPNCSVFFTEEHTIFG